MKRITIFSLSLTLVFLLSTTAAQATSIAKFCWKNSYGRGAGKPLSTCVNGMEKNGALCYPKCKAGYKGVGPVCWQHCPKGFRDDGAFCAKPKSYGRGAGYPWKFGDKAFSLKAARHRCEKKHGKGHCEKSGQIYYPKCKKGFHPVGCCVCSPNCVDGQKDIGVSCSKKSYGRGAGKPMHCASGMVNNAGLCYRKCKQNFTGVGPVCWARPPKGWANCGMGAAKNSKTCASTVFSQVSSVGNLAITVATLGTSSAATGAAKSSEEATKLAKLRAQFARLQKLYEENKKAIKAVTTAKKAGTAGYDATILGMNAATATPEDIARVSAEIAAILDPTGVASTVAAYTYPTCNKVQ